MQTKTGPQLTFRKSENLDTYSLIFCSTSQGECQVTRSRFRKPEENHSDSIPFSTPFISWKGEHESVGCRAPNSMRASASSPAGTMARVGHKSHLQGASLNSFSADSPDQACVVPSSLLGHSDPSRKEAFEGAFKAS